MVEALEGLSGYHRIVDDIIIYDKDPQQHIEHVRQFLQRCKDKKISINRDKWQFCQRQVKFAGFHLIPEGYQVDSSIMAAITQFPTLVTHTFVCQSVDVRHKCNRGINNTTQTPPQYKK